MTWEQLGARGGVRGGASEVILNKSMLGISHGWFIAESIETFPPHLSQVVLRRHCWGFSESSESLLKLRSMLLALPLAAGTAAGSSMRLGVQRDPAWVAEDVGQRHASCKD
jgi:hypothetical protein